ncbi:hypothetical protein B0H17DRAFT_1219698 [Mycena rosella]|uniref:Uncharacterized protein n=1 Tax=Mycena rosella TaxID=1033263 RepID=A0AAD7FH45_MYCRO|nr:hypothetical protein B0H17DRAFT_1219698 [Mycena rosella]
MPRPLTPKYPLLRTYPGLCHDRDACRVHLRAPPDYQRDDDEERPHHKIWTVEEGRINGIHINAVAKNQAIQGYPDARTAVHLSIRLAHEHLARRCLEKEGQPSVCPRPTQAEQTAPRQTDQQAAKPCVEPDDVAMASEQPRPGRTVKQDLEAYSVARDIGDGPLRVWFIVGARDAFITQDKTRALRSFLDGGGVMDIALTLPRAIDRALISVPSLRRAVPSDITYVLWNHATVFHSTVHRNPRKAAEDTCEREGGDLFVFRISVLRSSSTNKRTAPRHTQHGRCRAAEGLRFFLLLYASRRRFAEECIDRL